MTKKEYIDISKYYPLAVTLLVATAIVMAFCFGVAVSSTEKMIRPFDDKSIEWSISGKFGSARSEGGNGYPHQGIDYRLPEGTHVLASQSGTVEFAGWQNNYGWLIIINHGNNLKTYYAHLSKQWILQGAKVDQGQLIGEVGRTGRATGDHLHWEVRLGNIPIHPAQVVF